MLSAALCYQTAHNFSKYSVFSFTFMPAIVLSAQVEHFLSTRRKETPQTFTCFLQGPFGPRSRCLALGSQAVNRRWKWKGTGASSSHQARQNSRPGIGYTNRRLSEWNPYWLTRLIDSAAPATNCRLRLPPSVCNGDSGVSSYALAPPAYQI